MILVGFTMYMGKNERIYSSKYPVIAFPVAPAGWGLEKRAVRLLITPETSENRIAVIFRLVSSAMYSKALAKVICVLFEGRAYRH